jgi:hypothetical protein
MLGRIGTKVMGRRALAAAGEGAQAYLEKARSTHQGTAFDKEIAKNLKQVRKYEEKFGPEARVGAHVSVPAAVKLHQRTADTHQLLASAVARSTENSSSVLNKNDNSRTVIISEYQTMARWMARTMDYPDFASMHRAITGQWPDCAGFTTNKNLDSSLVLKALQGMGPDNAMALVLTLSGRRPFQRQFRQYAISLATRAGVEIHNENKFKASSYVRGELKMPYLGFMQDRQGNRKDVEEVIGMILWILEGSNEGILDMVTQIAAHHGLSLDSIFLEGHASSSLVTGLVKAAEEDGTSIPELLKTTIDVKVTHGGMKDRYD